MYCTCEISTFCTPLHVLNDTDRLFFFFKLKSISHYTCQKANCNAVLCIWLMKTDSGVKQIQNNAVVYKCWNMLWKTFTSKMKMENKNNNTERQKKKAHCTRLYFFQAQKCTQNYVQKIRVHHSTSQRGPSDLLTLSLLVLAHFFLSCKLLERGFSMVLFRVLQWRSMSTIR